MATRIPTDHTGKLLRWAGVAAFAVGLLLQPRTSLAHDLRAFLTDFKPADNTCLSSTPAPPMTPPADNYVRKYNTIAHKFLDEETGAGNVTLSMYAILDTIISEAAAELAPYPNSMNEQAERSFAVQSLKSIDCILLRNGFVYPGRGLVQLLSDGLEDTMYDVPVYLEELKVQTHNIRRRRFIEDRGAGPFHVVDCDVASYIFLAVAEVMGYPVFLVEIPRHNFIRWKFASGGYLNFETMDGFATDDAYYTSGWFIPAKFAGRGGILETMSGAQAVAYHQASVAIGWAWKGNVERMVESYRRSIATDATHPFALNNLAWFYAAAPRKEWRDGPKAVEYALQAIARLPDGDNLDTLACAYAQAGNFDRAIEIEKEAIQVAYAPFGSDLLSDLKLFMASPPQTCNDPGFGRDPQPFRPRHDTPTIASERSLQRLH
jgi:tetratricopeptide (TPR) repeat protein